MVNSLTDTSLNSKPLSIFTGICVFNLSALSIFSNCSLLAPFIKNKSKSKTFLPGIISILLPKCRCCCSNLRITSLSCNFIFSLTILYCLLIFFINCGDLTIPSNTANSPTVTNTFASSYLAPGI